MMRPDITRVFFRIDTLYGGQIVANTTLHYWAKDGSFHEVKRREELEKGIEGIPMALRHLAGQVETALNEIR